MVLKLQVFYLQIIITSVEKYSWFFFSFSHLIKIDNELKSYVHNSWTVVVCFHQSSTQEFSSRRRLVNRLCGNMKIYANTSSIWLTTVLYTQHLIHITTVCTRNLNTSIQLISLYFLHCWLLLLLGGRRGKIYFSKLPHNVSPFDFFLLPKNWNIIGNGTKHQRK